MLLFMDGFDHYTGGLADSSKWAAAAGVVYAQTSTTSPRSGLRCANGYYETEETVTPPLPVSGNGFVVGIAVKQDTAMTVVSDFLRIKEGSIIHLQLSYNPVTQLLSVKSGAGTVLAVGTTMIPINTWTYVEFKGTIHDTTGSYAVKIDGVAEASLTATGVDTRNGGTGQWDRFAMTTFVGVWHGWMDDVYVCDQSGSAPFNDFLGAVKIETLLPQTGNGTNVGLTPSTGTDHGALVDENPSNTTDYNFSSTVGAKDTYNLPAMAATGDIFAVQVNVFACKTDIGGRMITDVIRPSGGPDSEGTVNKGLITNFGYVSFIRPQAPGAIPWTKAIVDGMEVGVKVTV